MNILIWIILATIVVSLLALVGIITLAFKERFLKKILLFLIALSAGALMGGAFLHLIPESLEQISTEGTVISLLAGFILFFIIEKVLHWRHCHEGKCPIHTFAYTNLIGDTLHNFLDGLIIAAGFIVDIRLGIITTLAIIMHEIPQEIGDFGVLVYAGFSKFRALALNFLTALTAVFGGIVGYFLSSYVENITMFLVPLAAGGFIYIAASDLIPEIRKETNLKKSLLSFGIFILGIIIMYALKFLG